MHRKLVPAVLATALALAILAVGAAAGDAKKDKEKAKKAKGGHPVYVFADSSFVPAGANRVMTIAFLNTTTTAQAEQKFIPLFHEAVRGKASLTFVDEGNTAAEAERRGLSADYQALKRQWEGNRSFDPATLIRFADSLHAQYVMGGDVSEWSSTLVDWNVEGYSHSDVHASTKIFDGTTGKLVWEARDKVELKSSLHDPQAQSSGVVDDIGIQRGGRQTVPPAPPIDEAAREVAKNLAGALP